ncbi:MAG: pyridoxamine 5'-phosphate oxidase family protein [Propionibacteriales bacterium]|nr:pyridoxamine 5'-phosphate oxidase family protein [Propionibacteriales bacterium]
MQETADELAALQALLDESRARSTAHLRSIINDDHAVGATQLVARLTGMRLLSVATVTKTAQPRISALDGHFLHARWVFSTTGTSAKARHLRARPAVSVAHIESEEFAVFAHGQVEFLEPQTADFDTVLGHLSEHYGSSPLSWGDDIVLCRVQPTWMVGYAYAL